MTLYEDIMKEFIERLKREGVFSLAGLVELEGILTGSVENVEKDLVNLIKRENDIE